MPQQINPREPNAGATPGRNLARLLTCLLPHLRRVANSLQSPLLLVMRLYWGWSFFETGKGKLMNHGQTSEFFASLNIPFPELNALIAGSTECFGGLFLLIGLGSRFVSVPLIFTMLVAYATAETEALRSIFSDPDSFTGASPFLFLLTGVVVLAFGPGRFSIDHVLATRFFREGTSSQRP